VDSVKRAYRILGLYPGVPKDEIKRAYRDLAQVWHPDRFPHDARLREKAQNNLKRINEAFETLRTYDPPECPARPSRISLSFEAVRGIGDMLQTGMHRLSLKQKRPGFVVLGVDANRPGQGTETRAAGRPANWLRWTGLVLTLVAVALIGLVLLGS
jgi:hypothetical protein